MFACALLLQNHKGLLHCLSLPEVCKANTMPGFVCCMQGSFAKGAFAAYNMYEREVELSEVPNGNMEDS